LPSRQSKLKNDRTVALGIGLLAVGSPMKTLAAKGRKRTHRH
jgi:hypothetical protein